MRLVLKSVLELQIESEGSSSHMDLIVAHFSKQQEAEFRTQLLAIAQKRVDKNKQVTNLHVLTFYLGLHEHISIFHTYDLKEARLPIASPTTEELYSSRQNGPLSDQFHPLFVAASIEPNCAFPVTLLILALSSKSVFCSPMPMWTVCMQDNIDLSGCRI